MSKLIIIIIITMMMILIIFRMMMVTTMIMKIVMMKVSKSVSTQRLPELEQMTLSKCAMFVVANS